MPSAVAKFDLTSRWQPLANSFLVFHNDFGVLADCAESVLSEVEAIRQEVLSRARELEQLQRQLALREQQLAEQRTEYAKLNSQFEQQEARLTDTVAEVRQLREELSAHAAPTTLAADSARLALDAARESWQRDRVELLERLNALSLMQQTGSSDSEGVKAFCHELTEIHELITSSHHQTRDALDKERKELSERLTALAETYAAPSDNAAIDQLQESLRELREQVAGLQTQSSSTANRDKDELLARLDALAQAQAPASDDSPLLVTILEQLAETRELVQSVQSSTGDQATSHDAVIAELRRELSEMRQVADQARAEAGQSRGDADFAATLHSEMETLRLRADEARQHATRHETERTLVEAELDRLRTQAAEWRSDLEAETARHQEEERLWREELQEMRHLIRQAAAVMAEGSPGSHESAVVYAATPEKPAADAHEPADPVANSLMAQFAKLQKDSARRRTRGNNS